MAKVRDRDTRPEIIVRRLLFADGFRYRLHAPDLPGRPDIVFRSRRKAIFVHGCFWHRHSGCSKATTPKTRTAFWQKKFKANVVRDARNEAVLAAEGWRIFIVWECETRDKDILRSRLRQFLADDAEGGFA